MQRRVLSSCISVWRERVLDMEGTETGLLEGSRVRGRRVKESSNLRE